MKQIIKVIRDPQNKKELCFLVGELPNKDHLEFFYNTLECETIDIIQIKIKNKYFDLIIDDEGKINEKEPRAILYHDHNIIDFIAGDFIIAQANEDGETIPLTHEEINYIFDNLEIVTYKNNNELIDYVKLTY